LVTARQAAGRPASAPQPPGRAGDSCR